MTLKMSSADMEAMLGSVISANKAYSCKLWGVIMESSGSLLAKSIPVGMVAGALLGSAAAGAAGGVMGALSNVYCYIGCTQTEIYFVCVSSFNTANVTGVFTLAFAEIAKIKIAKSIIPGRRVIKINCRSGARLKLSIMNNAIGTDINRQKENADIFIDLLTLADRT